MDDHIARSALGALCSEHTGLHFERAAAVALMSWRSPQAIQTGGESYG